MRIPLSLLHRLRAGLVGLLSLGLAFPFGPLAVAQAGAKLDEHVAALSQQRRIVEELRSDLDPTGFDVGALGLELAFAEADEIIELLLGSVRYEVYPGVLRGAHGTLVAGAGNALDQALLLSSLLGDAGYEVRLALGQLSDADAWRLVERMFEPSPEAAAPRLEDAVDLIVRATGTAAAEVAAAVEELDGLESELAAEMEIAAVARDDILKALRQAGLEVGSDMTQQLLAEAREYAWLEYRFSSADDWQPVHLPFGYQEPPRVEAADHLYDTLPDGMVHRLRVELVLERKEGSEFRTELLMDPWEAPVANAFGKSFSVGNHPWGASADADVWELGTDEMTFFVPTLNGELAPGAQAFGILGHVLPPAVAADPAAELFQTMTGKMADATSLLGSIGMGGQEEERSEVLALTAQWLEFVLIAPGGNETRHRRYIFDRRPPAARAQGSEELLDQSAVLEGILNQQTFMVFPGALSPEYVANDASLQALVALDGLEAMARVAATDPGAGPGELLVAAVEESEQRDQVRLVAAFDGIGPTAGGVAYRAEPTLVVLHQAVTPGENPTVRSGVDVVTNARRFLTLGDGTVTADAPRAVLAGVWETLVELRYMQQVGDGIENTLTSFEAAEGAALVMPGDIGAAGRLGVPEGAKAALNGDLERGYAALLPTGEGVEEAGYAWWRVDPATGETLGVSADGRGAAATEYTGLQKGVAASVIYASMSTAGIGLCLGRREPENLAMCICDVLVTGAVVGGAGLLIGIKFATAAGILTAVNVGYATPLRAAFGIGGICSGVAYFAGSSDPRHGSCRVA